jgi:hypothetical protein
MNDLLQQISKLSEEATALPEFFFSQQGTPFKSSDLDFAIMQQSVFGDCSQIRLGGILPRKMMRKDTGLPRHMPSPVTLNLLNLNTSAFSYQLPFRRVLKNYTHLKESGLLDDEFLSTNLCAETALHIEDRLYREKIKNDSAFVRCIELIKRYTEKRLPVSPFEISRTGYRDFRKLVSYFFDAVRSEIRNHVDFDLFDIDFLEEAFTDELIQHDFESCLSLPYPYFHCNDEYSWIFSEMLSDQGKDMLSGQVAAEIEVYSEEREHVDLEVFDRALDFYYSSFHPKYLDFKEIETSGEELIEFCNTHWDCFGDYDECVDIEDETSIDDYVEYIKRFYRFTCSFDVSLFCEYQCELIEEILSHYHRFGCPLEVI